MTIQEEVQQLSDEVAHIKERNQRVEADKAWELSRTRVGFIALTTYILIVGAMFLIKDDHPFLNATIATIGYLVSSASYNLLKKRWLSKL